MKNSQMVALPQVPILAKGNLFHVSRPLQAWKRSVELDSAHVAETIYERVCSEEVEADNDGMRI